MTHKLFYNYSCKLNCKSKYAVTSNMIVEALCDDCNETEVSSLTYQWILKNSKGQQLTNFDETGKR